jgi:hypothetical protein
LSDSNGENGAPPPLAPRSSILLEIARNVACTDAPIYAIYITIARRPLARPRFDASKAEGTYGKLLSAAHNHHESQHRQCRWTRDELPMPLNIDQCTVMWDCSASQRRKGRHASVVRAVMRRTDRGASWTRTVDAPRLLAFDRTGTH